MTETVFDPTVVLGGLSAERFLAEFWQRKPLLVRGAFPGFSDPISPEELAGLACEPEVESRLVLERGGNTPWALQTGPFAEETFLGLAETHWSLLVQDAEKHLPALRGLLEPFRFIPDWRIDDLQISYSAPGGGVGPHWDDYDVFLVQGLGRKRWSISTAAIDPDNQRDDTQLRILRDFDPEHTWDLEPGDLLYLPPRVAHHGIALEGCLTYSIGFRAPAHAEIVQGYFDFLAQDVDPGARYGDAGLKPATRHGRIDAGVVDSVREIILKHLTADTDAIAQWLGGLLTETKPQLAAEPMDEPWDADDLAAHLKTGATLERHPGSRLAYMDHDPDQVLLFVDGQALALSPSLLSLAEFLCEDTVYSAASLRRMFKVEGAEDLVLDLINEGVLVAYDD